MPNKPVKSYSHYIISGIIAVILFLIVYAVSHKILTGAIISVIVFVVLVLLTKPQKSKEKLDLSGFKNKQDIRAMLSQGHADLAEINSQRTKVSDLEMRKKVETVCNSANKIVDFVEKNPAKASEARRFFTYYIDMTKKILTKYNDYLSTGIQSDESAKVIDQTSRALDLLEETFTKIFDKLIQNDVMDIEADVNLLENMLKSE